MHALANAIKGQFRSSHAKKKGPLKYLCGGGGGS